MNALSLGIIEANALDREHIFEECGWAQIECDLIRDFTRLGDDAGMHYALVRLSLRVRGIEAAAARVKERTSRRSDVIPVANLETAG